MRSYRCAILASLIVVVSVFACFERAFAQGSLPSGWSDTDIGQVGVVGSATYASNVFTVSAGGSALPGVSSDAFHYVYQPLSGDGTIVERVTSISNTGANAAVMIRETLSATSNYLSMDIYNGSVCAGYRTGGGNSGCTSGGSVTLPRWLKVVRSGSIFSGFFSADGTNWTQVGANTTISMAQNVYIGLATTGSTSSASP